MRLRLGLLVGLLVGLPWGPSAIAEAAEDSVEATAPNASWWQRINDALDEAAAPYRIVPPSPREVHWNATKIWSGSLPGEVVDILGVDLGADGKSELVALTNRELIVFSRIRGLFDIRTQAQLPDNPAAIRSRDPIGSLSSLALADAPLRLRARSSDQAMGVEYQWTEGKLVKLGEFAGYPICGPATIPASVGRNYFLGKRAAWPSEKSPGEGAGQEHARRLAEKLYSVECSDGLVDPSGLPSEYLSAVSIEGELTLRCEGEEAHCQSQTRRVQEVGDTHLVADANNDGLPEIFYSARGAPGAADRLVVIGQGGEASAPLYQKDFRGGIVGMAAGDFAGDGAVEIIVAVRKPADKRVTLWLLN